MALDGVLLSGIINELSNTIVSGRVDKIYQTEKDELQLIIRNKGTNYRLLISASANHPRIHISKYSKDNPESPPMFCMVLRKHLLGARVKSLTQPLFDRIAELTFEVITDMGDLEERKLIVEIMGRHSNVILLDASDRIIDSIKHVGFNVSRVRQVLPGLNYVSPPSHEKIDPRYYDSDKLFDLLSEKSAKDPANIIMTSFNGISKISAKEIISNALLAENASSKSSLDLIVSSFNNFISHIKNKDFKPIMVLSPDSKPIDILPFDFSFYKGKIKKEYNSFSALLDDFYLEKDKHERANQMTSDIRKLIKNRLDRCKKNQLLYKQDIERAESAISYKLYGELITANIHSLSLGMDSARLVNYYDEKLQLIDIPLDPTKSPAQNAQNYFKLASKANTTISKVNMLIKDTIDEIKYLESLDEALSRANKASDIDQIKEELIEQGYIKKKSKKKKPTTTTSNKPIHYKSSDSYDIFVGKNNMQNDMLTFKKSSNNDIWLHIKNLPGSHVLIKYQGEEIPDTTLYEAALLAAYYSKARDAENVAVDYCMKKNVRKPKGARPGMVIYDNYKTLYVTPSDKNLSKLKRLN